MSILLLPVVLSGQVKELSYTLSPQGEYIFWGDKSGLSDGFAVGGKLGFGFGQFFELSGTYLQSLDLTTDFTDFGIPDFSNSDFVAREVNWQRYGGEVRVNLSQGTLLPFITMGSGIQRTELMLPKTANTVNEQIYLDLGAGVVLSLADRYTLTLAAKNAQYRFNAARDLLSELDRQIHGINAEDYSTEKVVNWGLNASLQFYIGGRSPDRFTDIDRAYRETFGSGLRGISVPIEPVAGKINFHENLPFRNTWYAGGNIGINLGSYIGLRGFYWHAMKEEDFRNFDDLSLYGGEAKFNLNTGQGITPFITIGGGYLDVKDSYIARPERIAEDQPFAMGGAGLTLPLSPYFKLFGGVRAMLLTDEDLNDLAQPNDVLTSWNYHFGARLIVGQKAKDPSLLIQEGLNKQLNQQQLEYQSAENKIREEYQNQISQIERAVQTLKAQNDSLLALQSQLDEALLTGADREIPLDQDSIEKRQRSQNKVDVPDNKTIRLSPEELGELMKVFSNYGIEMKKLDVEAERIRSKERIISRTGKVDLPFSVIDSTDTSILFYPSRDTSENQSIGIPLDRILQIPDSLSLENSVFGVNKSTSTTSENPRQKQEFSTGVPEKEVENIKTKYEDKINKYEDDIFDQKLEIEALQFELNEQRKELQKERIASESLKENLFEIDPEKRFETSDSTFIGRMYYRGLSAVGGMTLGEQMAITLGFRTNFGIRNSSFRLMTETYAGMGSNGLLGLSFGGLYGFRIAQEGALSSFIPYAGIGIGLQQTGGRTGLQGTYGLILGAELELWEGKAFVDYTMRNLFDYNQIVLGYKLPF